jgi:hypothetical protein
MVSFPPGPARQIYGIDFSGAADAGKKIWITKGVVEGEALRIEACYQGADLPGSGVERDRCLAALQAFIAKETGSAFGLDFPFGLPRELVKTDTWEDFVLSFPEQYPRPEAFRETCRADTGGSELKRLTDRESHTPFSPYNIRLYRQTYYGLRDVIAPLVRDKSACVLPMQTPAPDKPWVVEICPASTLKREYLYWPYKGKSREHREGRERILESIEQTTPLLTVPETLRPVVLDDPGGDALDSVVAAVAVCRALREPGGPNAVKDGAYGLEGYVYV